MGKYLLLVLLICGTVAGFGQNARDLYNEAVLREKSSPEEAYLSATKALKLAELEEDQLLEAEVLQLLGKIFYDQGAFMQAMEYYHESDAIYMESHDEDRHAQNQLELAKVYYYLKQSDKSLDLITKAQSFYERTGANKWLAEVYGQLGHMYEKAEKYDTAWFYENKALKLHQQFGDSAGVARVYENLGSILEDKEDYAQARHWFSKAASFNGALKNEVALVGNLNNIGDSYRKMGVLDSAYFFTHRALEISQSLELRYQESSALRDLSKVFLDSGESKIAYQYLDKSSQLYEELYSQEAGKQVALLQTLYDLERKNAEIIELENQQRIEGIKRIGMMAGGLSLLLIGGIVVSRQRLKIRKNQQLMDQEKALHKAALENSELQAEQLKMELEHKQLQEKHLELELELGQKALASRMLQLIEKNKLLEALREDIYEIESEVPAATQKKVKYIANQINYSFNHDKSWEDFRKSFEQVHSGFFDKLKKGSAELTSNDLRICALMRINLGSKDIASLLGISTDSLRVARYRLRKKLNIDQGDNLRKFILSI
ncbi:tetratricopeptide repeat protein [Owenweeksia hongkongensis]|uniref:tetratricopeptide repeat protein n=1 Tax=Owenweeksia hongkongensis TaxID=253245 RepID=UPI003A8FEEDA